MGILDSALVRRVRQTPALRPPAIAAYRTVDRLMPAPSGPRVIANSMPKSGTHLLASLLDQLEGMRFGGRLVAFDCGDQYHPDAPLRDLEKRLRNVRDSHYLGGHLIRDPRVEELVAASGVRFVTILRDPRAVVVSGAHYVMDAKQLKGRAEALERFPDLSSILRALVFGDGEPGDPGYFPEIGERYAAYVDWVDAQVGTTVLFEDLIGGRGGGSQDRQVSEVARLVGYLGYHAGVESADAVAQRLFSEKAITFRAGSIDSWREDLPADLVEEIETRCAGSMARLGYQ
ncbi:hypothetical protein [Nocardioides sp.]|uniref:hypothetical protein n=1 Tax=Nocardioides sp. TaxID=35761 RepID=UPI002733BD83|nr:hypothetical protein [Nocardioides sp.]MDP3894579.1 hypothetical protein [Nocardioides sp.]